MTYAQALGYLASFTNYEKVPDWPYRQVTNLKRFQEFLDAIDNPQASLPCIHVAGSKGKGSTSAFCAYILRAAGFRVGLYTSPHLTDFRERVRILEPMCAPVGGDFEGMIPRQAIARLIAGLKPSIERHARSSAFGPLTFFEAYTALAFLYFKEQKVQYAVLETGLGGRLDATNTVRALVSVITPISYEHTDKLGATLSRIAQEKVGIIKKYTAAVINAPQAPEARRVIADRCAKKGAVCVQVGKDITYALNGTGFSVRGLFGTYDHLRTSLVGRHQLENAAAAIGAVESLRFYGVAVGTPAIRRGIRSTRWPGRCEVIAKRPLVVIDGAQNRASARVLAQAIRENFRYRKLILVLGISQDKDREGICSELRPLADRVILTRADTPRATAPEELAQYFRGKRVYTTAGVAEAKKLAHEVATPHDLVLVCGSLFVVGEFRS